MSFLVEWSDPSLGRVHILGLCPLLSISNFVELVNFALLQPVPADAAIKALLTWSFPASGERLGVDTKLTYLHAHMYLPSKGSD